MQDTFRVFVCGSRNFDDYAHLCRTLDGLLAARLQTHRVVILHGGCRGADTLADAYARSRDLAVKVFPADWQTHGRAAGPKRNARMIAVADACVAFWDGSSTGTRDTIERAKAKGIPLRVITPARSSEPPHPLRWMHESIGR